MRYSRRRSLQKTWPCLQPHHCPRAGKVLTLPPYKYCTAYAQLRESCPSRSLVICLGLNYQLHKGVGLGTPVQMDTNSCILCSVSFQPSVYGNATKMANEVAKRLSRGSIGCIAALDQLNPRKILPGTEPWLGVELKVRWKRLMGIEIYLT